MKKSIFKTFGKQIVAGAIFFSLFISPVTVSAQYAQTPTTDLGAELSALTAALTAIGSLIVSADNLSETERYSLFSQLITISSQILRLRVSNSNNNLYVSPLASEATKDSAEDAGLTRVKVSFNSTRNEAVTDVTIKSITTRNTYTFPELASVSVFNNKIKNLRELVAMKVSNENNVKYRDVYKKLFVTALDPLRNNFVNANSSTATYLSNNFSKHSILSEIQVLPGDGTGMIKILSDQDDLIELAITREIDYAGNPSGNYSFKYQYFIDDDINPYYDFSSLNDVNVPRPLVTEITTNLSEEESTDYLRSVFNAVPFTSEISNFDKKLFRFLINNPTDILGFANFPDNEKDCYYESDKVVVDEFIEYVVEGLGAQFEDISSITKYIAPYSSSEFESGCSSRTRFF